MLVQIANKRIKQLRNKQISLVKVIWNDVTGDATWELEEKLRENYPYLFLSNKNFEDEISISRGEL
uniref:Chromo domain-containing protein n=1 Tax=Cajanus cajan TaxID=3821 RepID=A0A151U3C0_CAJCA|nr:hypothetical protein KK1_006423 [Cajanus cajan]